MKNLRKLVASDLKKINGGNAPDCQGGYIACRHKPQNGIPGYWSCEPPETGCDF